MREAQYSILFDNGVVWLEGELIGVLANVEEDPD